jgi:hypothetical protein
MKLSCSVFVRYYGNIPLYRLTKATRSFTAHRMQLGQVWSNYFILKGRSNPFGKFKQINGRA